LHDSTPPVVRAEAAPEQLNCSAAIIQTFDVFFSFIYRVGPRSQLTVARGINFNLKNLPLSQEAFFNFMAGSNFNTIVVFKSIDSTTTTTESGRTGLIIS
jgi:hypothetical protein